MEYVYAALVLYRAGTPITERSLLRVLRAAGVDPDAGWARALAEALEGDADVEEAVETAVDDESEVDTYTYAGLLLHETGEAPTERRVTAVLEAARADVDPDRVAALVEVFDDVDIDAFVRDRLGPPETVPGAPDRSLSYDDLDRGDRVGAGGNADVVRATVPGEDGDLELAVKTPRISGTLRADDVERLVGEAETWSDLDDHAAVVDVVDYGDRPLPWIAMEYVDGGHLGGRAGDLGTRQALWTGLTITRGVRHAHRHGVVHFDLKPANVLFRTVEGAWDVPKVGDWGLSKRLLDHSGTVEGLSPAYAAPEQFDDEFGPTDDVTDVYGLGTVLYELFTGRPPFEGSTATVMRSVLDPAETPPRPSDVADVPDRLDELLLTALATEREDRYDDVIYLRDALAELYEER